jgi:GntR family transcriptional repressor for pyruvate dehydrogenase complex
MATSSIYQAVERKKVYQEVVDQITELILQNHLEPGDRLPPERELAEHLAVSRTAVREAIRVLEQRGLVEVKQGAGTYVRCLSPEVVTESLLLYFRTNIPRYLQLMDLREILDVEIAARLAEHIEPEHFDRLESRIATMWKLLDSPQEFAEQDAAFHMDLYRATENQVLLLIMQPVMDLLVEAMIASFQMPGSAESSLRSHERLMECIRAGDPEVARDVVREILARGKGRMEQLQQDA